MQRRVEYRRCTAASADSVNTCVVSRVFGVAAADHVLHIKVNGSFGACTAQDELVVQLNHIGELCFTCLSVHPTHLTLTARAAVY